MALAPLFAWGNRDGQAYVGVDRRATPTTTTDRDRLQLLVALGAAAALWIGIELSVFTGNAARIDIDTRALSFFVDAVAIVGGAVVSLLAFMRWRLTGEARPLWIGAAAVLLGPVAAGAGTLLPAVAANASGLPGIRIGARLVAMAALWAALLWPEVDTRLRPVRLNAAASAAAGLVGLAWVAAPWPAVREAPWAQVLLTLGWVATALVARRAYGRTENPTALSVAVGAAVLGLGESVWGAQAVATTPDLAIAGATALQAAGLAVLLTRGVRDLETAFCVQRQRLLETEIAAEIERARDRARRALDDERVHDARNSLLAIEGTATVLDRFGDRIEPERAAGMLGALNAEVGHLRNLVASAGDAALGPFDLAEMVALVVKSERKRGMPAMEVDVEAGLVVVGRYGETAEVVRHFLDNARRHAPGSPVQIRAERDREWVSLFVEDRGRGIDRQDREVIFQRGHTGSQGTDGGNGLGLFVARKLMQEQGGDVWVDNRTGGGASFGLCLRAADEEDSPDQGADRPSHLEEAST